MIHEGRSPLMTWGWSRYVHWKLRRQFRALWATGALPAEEPVVLYANHTNFWDGFLVHAVVTHGHRDGFVMMEEQNLARFRFLRHLGAFSVRRGSSASARETLQHATTILRRPRASVLVFPQGKLAPFDAPLELERGAELLARWAGVRCVPMALRYALFEHEYPDALIAIGEPHDAAGPDEMAARLGALRSALARVERPDTLPLLLSGRRSVADAPPAAPAVLPAPRTS
ncbi:MAG: lysophospholipid acyltransferase family protein [Myxococcaceae bacterium]